MFVRRYRIIYILLSHIVMSLNLVMKLLIESLLFFHLSYSISVWGVSLKQHLVKRLERLQNHAVRLLFHLQKFDHVTCYYRRVSWLPFSDLIKYHSMCVMFHQFRGCGKGILLKPPIRFGRLTDYHTRTRDFFTYYEVSFVVYSVIL